MTRRRRQVIRVLSLCAECGAEEGLVVTCWVFPDNTFEVADARWENNDRSVVITRTIEGMVENKVDYTEADAEHRQTLTDEMREAI